MSYQQATEKPKKAPSPEQQERKKLKDQKAALAVQMKAIDEKLVNLTPKKKTKAKIVLTESMRLAKTVEEQLHQTVDEIKDGKPTGRKVPKRVANKTEFRSRCAVIVGLKDINADLTRAHIEAAVKEGIALLNTMPKPPKVKKGEAKPSK